MCACLRSRRDNGVKNGPCFSQPTETLIYATRTGSDLTTYQLLTEGEEGREEQGQRKKKERAVTEYSGPNGAESWYAVDPVRKPVSWVQAEC